MTLITRRSFVRRTALCAALCASPLASIGRSRGFFDADEQNDAPLDADVSRKLASRIVGQVFTPQNPEYDAARVIFNRAFDRRPAVIVRCAAASDVARSLEFAQNHSLPIAVRGGGHNRAGFGVCDGGVVIDLSAMNRVEVDADKRVARAQAGALVRDLDQATQRFALATTSGGCPTVGVAGFTLGGGEGLLMSKYGAGCDNLLSAHLVTVDGKQVEVSENSNPDLFWAIRGGGGNFGVVTELEYRLHSVDKVLAGNLTYPPGRIPELLQAFAKLVSGAPDELNVVGELLPSGHGTRFMMLFFYLGDFGRGKDLLRPWQAFKPAQDTVKVASYLETQATINPYSSVAHFQTVLTLPELNDALIALLTSATSDAPPNTRAFIVPLYGAISRVGVSETAFPLRQRAYELDLMGRCTTPAEKEVAVQWVTNLRDKLRPLARATYVNQLGETSEDLVKLAYGPNYARLVEIKKKYDPNNVLRLNQNIKPD